MSRVDLAVKGFPGVTESTPSVPYPIFRSGPRGTVPLSIRKDALANFLHASTVLDHGKQTLCEMFCFFKAILPTV